MSQSYGPADEAEVHRHAASRHRARLHLLRHRRGLRPVHERGAARAGAEGPARPGDARHQVRLPLRGGKQVGTERDSRPETHPRGGRGLAAAAQHRPYRPALPAPRRPGGADRGRRRHGRRAGARGQGALLRPVGGGRGQHPPRPCRRIRCRRCRANIRCGSAIWRPDVIPALRELGIGLVPFAPLGRGFLTGAVKRAEEYPEGDFRRGDPRYQGENFDANCAAAKTVHDIARR